MRPCWDPRRFFQSVNAPRAVSEPARHRDQYRWGLLAGGWRRGPVLQAINALRRPASHRSGSCNNPTARTSSPWSQCKCGMSFTACTCLELEINCRRYADIPNIKIFSDYRWAAGLFWSGRGMVLLHGFEGANLYNKRVWSRFSRLTSRRVEPRVRRTHKYRHRAGTVPHVLVRKAMAGVVAQAARVIPDQGYSEL